MKRLLALCLTLIMMQGAAPSAGAYADGVTLTVKGGWLRLRETASFDADTISSYYTGTKVTVISTSGAWYCVRTPDGRVGYMYGSYLSSASTGTGSGSSAGNENITAYVTSSNGKGVRMRTGPGTAYGVVRQYSVGTKATILSSGTYWHYISIDGQKGYMMAKYLTTSQVTPPPAETTSYTAYVTSGNGKSVNLRKGPSTGYGSVGSYAVGTQVTVMAHTGEWSYVTINTRKGYMMTKYLTTEKPSAPPVDATYTAYVTSGNGRSVNLRKGPDTSYGSYGSYDVGTQVTVLSKSGSWSYIDVGSRKGYMMSKYLTTSKPVTGGSAASTYTAYVTSSNGKGVHLRSGAGQGYSSMGLYSVGTQVTVLRHNSTWDYIRIGSREGYMMNKYLTTNKPSTNNYEITGVTISDAYPVVGETLWANVTPSGANVTYEWMTDNGLLLSSNASYLLTNEDVGRKIRVRVTGKNSYTGSAVSSFATVGDKDSNVDVATPIRSVSIDNSNPTVGDTLTAGVLPTGTTANYRWIRSDGTQVGNAKAYTVQAADVGLTLRCEVSGTGEYTGTASSGNTAAVKDNAPVTTPISGTVVLPSSAKVGVDLYATVSVNCTNVTYHWYAGSSSVGSGNSLTTTADMAGKSVTLVIRPADGSGYTGQVESNACSIIADPPQEDPATTTDL